MKLKAIKVDPDAIEKGRWVGNLPGLTGVEFFVRGFSCLAYRDLQAKQLRELSTAKRMAGLSTSESDQLQNVAISETILLDWRGLQNDDDSPLAFSREKALELLSDPELAVLRNAVIMAASLVGEIRDDAIEADAKN